jgi:hypothetical protein
MHVLPLPDGYWRQLLSMKIALGELRWVHLATAAAQAAGVI